MWARAQGTTPAAGYITVGIISDYSIGGRKQFSQVEVGTGPPSATEATLMLYRATGAPSSLAIQSSTNAAYWISQQNNMLQIGGNGGTLPTNGAINVTYQGQVGIGTNPTVSSGILFSVNGPAEKPGGGSWSTLSDERLKNIKGPFTPGLGAVMALRPIRYEYKPDNALGAPSGHEHIGFSAQEVKRVIPEAVSKSDRGYLLVDNDPIMWTMVNAIQEQQKEIEHLRESNAALGRLPAENTELRQRLERVEEALNRLTAPPQRPPPQR